MESCIDTSNASDCTERDILVSNEIPLGAKIPDTTTSVVKLSIDALGKDTSSQMNEEASASTTASQNENNSVIVSCSTTPVAVNTTSSASTEIVRTISKAPTIICTSSSSTSMTNTTTATTLNVPKTSLITVVNTPLGSMKTLCVTPACAAQSNAPLTGQFTVVNSAPLNAGMASIKTQTITLINSPVTVVKAVSSQLMAADSQRSNHDGGHGQQQPPTYSLMENRGHNATLKNTTTGCCSLPEDGVPASNPSSASANVQTDGQSVNASKPTKNPVKIVGHVLMSPHPVTTNSLSSTTLTLNRISTNFTPQQLARTTKIVQPFSNANNNTSNSCVTVVKPLLNTGRLGAKKNIAKATEMANSLIQFAPPPLSSSSAIYPVQHKIPLKTTLPSGINNNSVHFGQQPQQPSSQVYGIKTLTPRILTNSAAPTSRMAKSLTTQSRQSGVAARPPNKLNYIGKHAIQAQRIKSPSVRGRGAHHRAQHQSHYLSYMCNNLSQLDGKQLTFNQALTAEILETLGTDATSTTKPSVFSSTMVPPVDSLAFDDICNKGNVSDIGSCGSLPMKCESVIRKCERDLTKMNERICFEDSKSQTQPSTDMLALICQAIMLDHNYYATPPPDASTKSTLSQMNGTIQYSPTSPSKKCRSVIQPPTAVTHQTPLSLGSSSILPTGPIPVMPILSKHEDAKSDISEDSDRENDTEGEETDTAPEAEAVCNEDQFGDYVTRCLCGFLHDDGYMVECDRCKVWQHVQCVVKNKHVPEEYLCEVCDPLKPIDRQRAKLVQEQWLKERQIFEQKLKETKQNVASTYRNRKDAAAVISATALSDTDSSDGDLKRSQSNNNNTLVHAKGRPPAAHKLKANRKREQSIVSRAKNQLQAPQKRQIKKRRVVKRRLTTKSQLKNVPDDGEVNSEAVAAYLPQLRQWIENYEEAVTNHYSPELRARISSIRVNGQTNNSDAPSTTTYDCDVHKCRVHTQPLTEIKYLVATVHLTTNTSVIELRGKYMLSTQHRNVVANVATPGANGAATSMRQQQQHLQRPGPFLFFHRLPKDNTEVCVDTRTYGNSARFVRRSCRPNAELRHCIEKGVLHLYVVTCCDVEKNCEITIKHESHDLAAVGTTHISCACGNTLECTVNNKMGVKKKKKKNGDIEIHRNRRGRKALIDIRNKSSAVQASKKSAHNIIMKSSPPSTATVTIKTDVEEVKDNKIEKEEKSVSVITKPVAATTVVTAPQKSPIKAEETQKSDTEMLTVDNTTSGIVTTEDTTLNELIVVTKSSSPPPLPPPSPKVNTRRASVKSEKDVSPKIQSNKRLSNTEDPDEGGCGKQSKPSREQRKLEAILRAIAQMEKTHQRKRDNQAKQQQNRRDSEPGVVASSSGEKSTENVKIWTRRRKGRARAGSTPAIETPLNYRMNSSDSYHTSGDENQSLLSPPPSSDHDANQLYHRRFTSPPNHFSRNKDVSLLLALSSSDNALAMSPMRDVDSNPGSSISYSSPETPPPNLSSACLLVQAAVEPMEANFKLPKTKKALMNEWLLNRALPEHRTEAMGSAGGGSGDLAAFYGGGKNLAALAQVASFCDGNNLQQLHGNAKKRWLRQAMGEGPADSFVVEPVTAAAATPGSPPHAASSTSTSTLETWMATVPPPPKKRRLPRESVDGTPPDAIPTYQPPESHTTTTSVNVTSTEATNNNVHLPDVSTNPPSSNSVDNVHMNNEASVTMSPLQQSTAAHTFGLLDPRLNRNNHPHQHLFNSERDLIGTVEKTLSILGLDDRKKAAEIVTPAKRKLSINEYRQRKQKTYAGRDRTIEDDSNQIDEEPLVEESNSSEPTSCCKSNRICSESVSSDDSGASVTSSSEDEGPVEVTVASSAFNSEPTELERQRELSSIRLKKVFGIPINGEAKKPPPLVLGMDDIINCEMSMTTRTLHESISRKSPTCPPHSFDLCPTSSSLVVVDESSSCQPTTATASDDISCNNGKPQWSSTLSPPPSTSVIPSVEKNSTSPLDSNDRGEQDNKINNTMAAVVASDAIVEDIVRTCQADQSGAEQQMERDDSATSECAVDKKVASKPVDSIKVLTPNTFEDMDSTLDYVPPFNNPIYPNDNSFLTYTSSIDDDERYEGRNPSPPLNLNSAANDFTYGQL